ncbi:MAG: DNA helicase I [Thalassobius sp.]|nr:DNA helicase I [Thalassovita sp.]
MHETLKIYQKRLTNLTSKNRSLLLLKLNNSQFLDIHQCNYLDNQPSYSVIESLIAQKKDIVLCSNIDSRDKDANAVSANLRKISRTEKMIFEERGAKDLYVGYPFVQGKMLDDSPIRCPLLFFPVNLELKQNQWVLNLRKDAGITFNKSLLLAFSHYNNISFDEIFIEHDFSEYSFDSQEFRTELYKLLKESPLELHFNQSTFEDTLQDFRQFTKSDFLESTETGKLKMTQEAVLGIFPQAGSYLMPDYDFLLSNERVKDLESFFASELSAEEDNNNSIQLTHISKNAQEEELFTPYTIDASQEEAIKSVKGGSSLVIQGPPGSGKSQLICNLIVDHIARGKNVLLVCQKKAALDVVYQRLGEKSFDDFVALVHDFKNDRKDIYENINRQIEFIDKFQRENNSLDAIYLERKFLQTSREIDQLTEELKEFKKALYDTSECGISVKELYLTSDIDIEGINLRREYNFFKFDNHNEILRKFDTYIRYHARLDTAAHLWYDRVSFANFNIGDLQQVEDTLKELIPYFEEVSGKVKDIIGIEISFDDFEWIYDRQEDFLALLDLIANEKTYRYFKNDLKYSKTDYLWLANRKKNTLSAFGKEGVESTLKKEELREAQEKLHQAQLARTNWYKKLMYYLFSKDKPFVDKLIADNNLQDEPNPLQYLMMRIDNRMNLEHQMSLLAEQEWLIELPENRDLFQLKDWFDFHLKAVDGKRIYTSLRNGIKYLEIEQFSYDELYKKINSLLNIVKEVKAKKAVWNQFLTTRQINMVLNGSLDVDKLITELKEDFDVLCEYDQLKASLNEHEKNILKSFEEKFEALNPETVHLFDNSLRIAWINHIETKYPILRSVTSEKMLTMENRLQDAVTEKQEIAKDIALLKARERTYSEVEYNRLNNLVTYRDLKHQVSKKRSIWPVRKLIQNFSHELLNLVPCWMGSPESVSAIFPMEEFFDLIIFDEASQCFAEKGIPAMYRGKQVVITGDDQQLAPYDLYHPRWEEDMEGETALEVVSLLDLGKQFVPEVSLKGHYRSKSLELIDFSNINFYKNQLQLIPHFEDYTSETPSIEYIKVDGVWEKNANQQEAQEVVQLLEKLVNEGETSIGIITFNYKQQEVIQDLLEEASFPLPRDFFIKNIENVQGDERDTIIFSVAYALSPKGKMTSQFGSLSQIKGENRLNVAVTRARKKIYLVSSIYPQQLQVDNAKNIGPQLLRDYLQYALEVSTGKYRSVIQTEERHNKSWYLRAFIKDKLPVNEEISLQANLPFADLSVNNAHSMKLLLTDDQLYYQSLSPKEIHAYYPELLRTKGWSFQRFYSRNYWKKKDHFINDYQKFVNL